MVVVGLGVCAAGELESVSDRSAMEEEEERSSKRPFRTVMLPALLRSLSGGVCRRGTCWGSDGTGDVEGVLVSAGIWVWDRSFMVSNWEEVARWTELGAGLSWLRGVERQSSYCE